MTRALSDIERDIAKVEARLADLHAERRKKLRIKNSDLIADFDRGMTTREIARARLMRYSTVQGILWRAGRTEKGRAAVRERIAQAVVGASP